MIYTVYSLINKQTFEPFYVGNTSIVKNRIRQHKNRFGDFIFNEIGVCVGKECADELEAAYIKEYKDLGYFLLNKNNGGNEPPSKKGVFYSEERKLNSFIKSPLKKTVYQIKDDTIVNIFLSVRDAGRQTGIDHRSISQVAAGSKVRKTAGGYLWKYKEDLK